MRYLQSIGVKVSYVEANYSEFIKLIAEHYNMEKVNGGYRYSSSNDDLFNF